MNGSSVLLIRGVPTSCRFNQGNLEKIWRDVPVQSGPIEDGGESPHDRLLKKEGPGRNGY